MATVLPDNPASQLDFFETHAPQWLANPSAIGLTDAQADAVAEATVRAAEAFAAHQAAQLAARNATRVWREAVARMRDVGGVAIGAIKIHAKLTGNPDVYAEAGVSRPEKPGPGHRTLAQKAAALPTIRTCTATPLAFDRAVVEWTCGVGTTGGAGVGMFYRVQRSVDLGAGDEPFELIDVVGSPGAGRRTNRFVDAALPEGARLVRYIITPMRGGAVGQQGPVASVQFAPLTTPIRRAERLAA